MKKGKLFRHPHLPYTPPDSAYKYHSYVMNPSDKEFLSNIFTHGIAIHICQSNMKARYYAMRIRCILYKKDKGVVDVCKFGVRGNDVVGWSIAHYPQRRIDNATVQRARDMGWVTQHIDILVEDANGVKDKMKRLLKDSVMLESEDAIKDYVMKSMEEGEDDKEI